MLGVDKVRQIVLALDKKTRGGGINWVLSGNGKFILTSIGSHVVELHETPDRSSPFDENDYIIMFTDGEVTIEAVSDRDLNENTTDNQNYYVLLSRIYQYGRRQASGADDALDDILRELSED